jgi:hypothetical protein
MLQMCGILTNHSVVYFPKNSPWTSKTVIVTTHAVRLLVGNLALPTPSIFWGTYAFQYMSDDSFCWESGVLTSMRYPKAELMLTEYIKMETGRNDALNRR